MHRNTQHRNELHDHRSWGPPRRGPGGGGRRRGSKRGGRRRPRISRGEVRIAILAVLHDEPMHGYQIMQELEDRSGGAWQPSPGSVYPTLQQLADEGLVVSESVDGRNVFHLTEDGAGAVAATDEPPPWERFAAEGGAAFADLRQAMFQLGAAVRQVAMAGTRAQAEAADGILRDARKAIYQLLAEDDAESADEG